MSFSKLSPLQRSMTSAFSALLAYAAWAYMMNFEYGFGPAIKAAAVQGGYSFLLTFVMTLLIEALYRFVCRIVKTESLINFLTWLITCSIVFSGSWWVNVIAGTPEVFDTVILGYVVGGAYTLAYVFGLSAKERMKSGSTQTS